MILIISSDDDRSTNDVIDWLRRGKEKFVRVSADVSLKLNSLKIDASENDIQLNIKGDSFKLSEFKSIWYRRSWIKFDHQWIGSGLDKDFDRELNRQLVSEVEVYSKYFLGELKRKSLNKPEDVFINKLTVLRKCASLGVKFPTTVVTSSKEEVVRFKQEVGSIITKNISQGIFVGYQGSTINSYTMLVTDEMIDGLEDSFAPMMFQNTVNKAFEIRAFYLNGKFYCSAILSQNDDQTKIDFRNYNLLKPNRTPPFSLPEKQEDILRKLMNELGLNSGSIDLLVTEEGEYIFLEVNPIGQFGQVSKPCNYRIEKKVAEYLMEAK